MKSENIMDHFNSVDTRSGDKHSKVITQNESDEKSSSILEKFNKAYGSNENKKNLLNEAAPLDTSSSMLGMFNNIKSEKNGLKMDTFNVHASDAKVTTTSSSSILDKFYNTYGNSLNNNSQTVQNNHSAQNNHLTIRSDDNFTNKFHSEAPRKDHESSPYQKRNLDDSHNNSFSQKDLDNKIAKNFEKSYLNQEKESKTQSHIDEKRTRKDEQGNNPFKEASQKNISLRSDKTMTSGNQIEFNFADKFKGLNDVYDSQKPKFQPHDINDAINHVSPKESLSEKKAKNFDKSPLTKDKEKLSTKVGQVNSKSSSTLINSNSQVNADSLQKFENKENKNHASIEMKKTKSNEHLKFKEKDDSVIKKHSQFPTDDMKQLKNQENKKYDPIGKQKENLKEKHDSVVKKHSSKFTDNDIKDFKSTENKEDDSSKKQKNKSNENLSFKEKDSVIKKNSIFQPPFDETKDFKTKENKNTDLIEKQKSKSNESLNFSKKFSNKKLEPNDIHSMKSMEKLDQSYKEHIINNGQAHQGDTVFETIETPGRAVKTKASLSKSQSFNNPNKNRVDKEDTESIEKVRGKKKIESSKQSSTSHKPFPEDDSLHIKEKFFRNADKEAESPSSNIKGNTSRQSISDKEVDLKSKKFQRQPNFESKKSELLHQSNFPNENELAKPKMKMNEETDLIIKKKNPDNQNEVEEIFVSQSKKTLENKSQHLQRDELIKKQRVEKTGIKFVS